MNLKHNLSQIYESSKQIIFEDSSKIILISDCHRGDGSWADDFMKNQNLFFAALTTYYNDNYTYIELGDGDELWKNKRISDITQIHSDAFWLISKFYKEGRFYALYGNHDMIKKQVKYLKKDFYSFFDEHDKNHRPLLKDIRFHEGLILKYRVTGDKILLVHGHQADCLNYRLWKLCRFLVRYFWKPLELIGVNDPTSTAKNYQKKESVEKNLIEWVKSEKRMLIAGHTHRPVFPKIGEPLYFNDGSCVHPRCITGIEIVSGQIMLVKWSEKTRQDGTLFVGREVLDGPVKLKDYFKIG